MGKRLAENTHFSLKEVTTFSLVANIAILEIPRLLCRL